MKKHLFSLLTLLFISNHLLADNLEMNGIRLNDYKNFYNHWNFVTTRYRKDSGEMRFTYANDLAWEVLKAGKVDYPDGAVFGKVSISTQHDSDFPSSVVPSGVMRIQFMVRDKKKYGETRGWGYALFDPQGRRHPGDSLSKTKACAACHAIVSDRGDVFSQIVHFLPVNTKRSHNQSKWTEKLQFINSQASGLPKIVKAVVPQEFKTVRMLLGELRKNLFYGTLDEVRPLLIEEAKRSKLPALLISEDETQFSVVFPVSNSNCNQDVNYSFQAIHTVPKAKNPTVSFEICEPKK